jgi:spore coat polysaccharide biosynthesis predicted glycosyltransferase SpsG
VVVGGLVQNAEEIEAFAAAHTNVTIHRAVTNMAQLMRSCDLAVCAAGTMLTECAAIGLPAIYFQVADNQKYNVEFWQNTGGMEFAGDASASAGEKEKTLAFITTRIKQLSENKQTLSDMKNALTGITDGRGAQRIAKALLTLN